MLNARNPNAHRPNGQPRIDADVVRAAMAGREPDIIAALLPDGVQRGKEWWCLHPGRTDTHLGSFSIALEGDRAGCFYDFATCESGDLFALVCLVTGCDFREALRWLAHHLGMHAHDPRLSIRRPTYGAVAEWKRREASGEARGRGCTLDALAQAKRLPAAFLRKLGLRELPACAADGDRQALPASVVIAYADRAGDIVAARFRSDLSAKLGSSWRRGDTPTLYGLDRLAGDAVALWLVEGESDCWCLWHAGVAALGIPGASMWRDEWAALLPPMTTIYAVQEPDAAGATLAAALRASPLRDRLRIVSLPAKDPADVWVADPDVERFTATLAAAEAASLPAVEPASDATGDPWPALVPLGRVSTAPPFNAAAMLPDGLDWFAEWGAAVADSIGVADDWPALLGLATASLAAAGAVEIEPWPGYREPAPLWLLALAPPSERKSPVFTAAVRPLREWEADEAQRLRAPLAQYRAKRRAAERRMDRITNDLAKADGLDAAALRAEMDPLAAELADWPDLNAPALTVTDTTPEALADVMQRNGGPAGLVDDEGAAIAALLGRYADDGARVELANKGYSGTPATIIRKGRDPVSIPRPLLACILAVQPAVLTSVLAANEAVARGFLARFLVVRPPSHVGGERWAPPEVPAPLDTQWDQAIRRMLALPRPGAIAEGADGLVRRAGEPAVVRLSPGAVDVARALYKDVGQRMCEGGDLADGFGWSGKLRGNLFRIALSMHLLADDGAEVSAETMTAAAAWLPYLAGHFHASIAGAVEPPELHHARRLLRAIGRRGLGTMTARDLFRLVEDSAVPDMEAFGPVLGVLIDADVVRTVPSERSRPGRQAARYDIHPEALPRPEKSDTTDRKAG